MIKCVRIAPLAHEFRPGFLQVGEQLFALTVGVTAQLGRQVNESVPHHGFAHVQQAARHDKVGVLAVSFKFPVGFNEFGWA